MKKILTLILSLTLVFALAACSIKIKGPDDASSSKPVTSSSEPSSSEPETSSSEPETSSSAPEKSDMELFMEEFGGVWVVKSSLENMYDDEYTFSFVSLEGTTVGSGVYPGGGDRPAKITAIKQEGDKFVLSLLYEAGEFMGEALEEETETLTILPESEMGTLFSFGVNNQVEMVYGGKTLDEAIANAKNLAK